jgi:hypothetical protein
MLQKQKDANYWLCVDTVYSYQKIMCPVNAKHAYAKSKICPATAMEVPTGRGGVLEEYAS